MQLLCTVIESASELYLLSSSAVDWSCLKLMSKENNDAGWRPYPRCTYEINFWKGTGLPALVTCLLCEMPCGTRTYPDPYSCKKKIFFHTIWSCDLIRDWCGSNVLLNLEYDQRKQIEKCNISVASDNNLKQRGQRPWQLDFKSHDAFRRVQSAGFLTELLLISVTSPRCLTDSKRIQWLLLCPAPSNCRVRCSLRISQPDEQKRQFCWWISKIYDVPVWL